MASLHFFHLPEADAPLLVDTPEKLNEARELISKALVVGIDCEWPPEETGHRPAATVLQLAAWCSDSGLHPLILVSQLVDYLKRINRFIQVY